MSACHVGVVSVGVTWGLSRLHLMTSWRVCLPARALPFAACTRITYLAAVRYLATVLIYLAIMLVNEPIG